MKANNAPFALIVCALAVIGCRTGENKEIDAVTGASLQDTAIDTLNNNQRNNVMDTEMPKSLIIVHSYHSGSTGKVADAIGGVLNSEIKQPQEMNSRKVQDYELVGFGSGIYSEKHSDSILALAGELPVVNGKKAFIFSTSSIVGEEKMAKDHRVLKEILLSKGYRIAGEFHCLGYNRNSFLKILGGINKGRPNKEDLKNAERFALELKKEL